MQDLVELIRDFGPLQTGKWLVGVSGGGDSVALLRLMAAAGMDGERMVVGNFNHGWGEFGQKSEDFVVELGTGLELDVAVGEGTGKALTNAEAVARLERMGWFGAICRKYGLRGVVLAHTQDDVVEGFLMRAGKGSGLTGLTGMKAESVVDGVKVVRPLLGVRREALREYLRGIGQFWLEDPDNEAGGSQRAKLRKLLPELEAAGVSVQGIAASVEALKDAEEELGEAVQAVVMAVDADEVKVERAGLQGFSGELGARVLGRMMRELGDEGMLVRRSKRIALWERILGEEKGAATLGGVKFGWDAAVIKGEVEHG